MSAENKWRGTQRGDDPGQLRRPMWYPELALQARGAVVRQRVLDPVYRKMDLSPK